MRKATVVFTETYIQNLKPRATRYVEFDGKTQGFGVRVYPTGRKIYVCQAVPYGGTNPQLITFDRTDLIPLEEARQLALKCLAAMARGDDPGRARRDERENTLYKVLKEYCEEALDGLDTAWHIECTLFKEWLNMVEAIPNPNHLITAKWVIDPAARSSLRDRPITRITRLDLLDRINQVKKNRGKSPARNVMAKIRAAFTWAFNSGRYNMQFNVAAGLSDKTIGITSKDLKRKRVITNDEIRIIWNASNELPTYGNIIKLLILTGARLREIGDARWDELDLDSNTLVVPPERFKTDEEHRIPLSPMAMAIIKSIEPKGPFIFSDTGHKPFTQYHSRKKKLDELTGITKPWVVHSLRHAVRTGLAPIAMPHICEAILGHAQPAITSIYNHYDYDAEKRTALELWATKVESIINPPPEGNVITLKRA